LSIVKAIVEQHGGRVSVSSNDPNGTTFTFTLLRATDTAAIELQGAQTGYAVTALDGRHVEASGEAPE
jgi:hypothetical protein